VSEPSSLGTIVQRSGDKRPASDDDFDEDPYTESDEDGQPELDDGRLISTLVFASSDSDSSQVCARWPVLSSITDALLNRTSPSGLDQKDNIGILIIPVSPRCTGHLPQKE
jgi:hypothetical protein